MYDNGMALNANHAWALELHDDGMVTLECADYDTSETVVVLRFNLATLGLFEQSVGRFREQAFKDALEKVREYHGKE